MSDDDLSPEDEFDLIVAELGDRTEEYLVCLREIPNVSAPLKVDFWNAAVNKQGEIAALHARLGELKERLASTAPAQPTRGARILIDACRAAGWPLVGVHTDARSLIHECRDAAMAIRDPVARNSAHQWLARALRYAEADRRASAIRCLRNAAPLRSR